jgi:predicted transcriptional regulator
MTYGIAQREALTQVAIERKAQRVPYVAIAEELGIDRRTVKTWIENEYARRSEQRSVSDAREAAIATYEAGLKAAWERLPRMHDRSTNLTGLLNNIRTFQERIDKLTGVETPVKYQEVEDEVEIFWDDSFTEEESYSSTSTS